MHELAVTEKLYQTVMDEVNRYKATKVYEVRVTMGAFNAFVPECISEYFKLMSTDTPSEGAKLVFNIKPVILKCRDCGTEFEMEYNRLKCIKCQSVNVDMLSGKEFCIEGLDIETDED